MSALNSGNTGALCYQTGTSPWKMVGNQWLGMRDQRKTSVEFGNPRHGDRFLASADKIKTITKGLTTIEQNDNAKSKIKSKCAKGGSPGFHTVKQKHPNREPKGWVKEGS